MKREYRPTSKQGENYIKPHKATHHEKIKEGLEKLKIGGTQEEIAAACGLREDQVWKRLSELAKENIIFDTGIQRKLKSGLMGIVWQLHGKVAEEKPSVVIIKPDGRKNQLKVIHNPIFDNI